MKLAKRMLLVSFVLLASISLNAQQKKGETETSVENEYLILLTFAMRLEIF